MKNIHIIPTDKPSRLWLNNLLQGKLELSEEELPYNTAQNIYITSDEEIKVGDWYLSIDNFVRKADVIWDNVYGKCPNKKIILTTDQDLIKDGVQAIDDEFLEWFVSKANDSGKPIDIVEVRKENYSERFDNDKSPIGNPNTWGNRWIIIIPKEEQKQNLIDMMQDDEKLGLYEETLEQVAENHINNDLDLYESLVDGHISYNVGIDLLNNLFIEGAKWMQERMYSDEEVLDILNKLHKSPHALMDIGLEKWFEQFKKK